MKELTVLGSNLDTIEGIMLELPQVDCEVHHHFGPGIYIREVTMPAGLVVIGHPHKEACMNVLVSGSLALVENGITRVIKAPMIFTTPPGRKLAYIIEDVVFQNIHATDETDVDTLEAMLVDKTDTWMAHQLEQAVGVLLTHHNKQG